MKEYSKLLSYYEKALKIRHKILPPSYSDLVNTYIKKAKVLENLQRYNEAVEYAERAVEIVRQVFSAEHHKIKENQEYLDVLRGKL
jgi:tetratricopeptide (TPR) repeat protein